MSEELPNPNILTIGQILFIGEDIVIPLTEYEKQVLELYKIVSIIETEIEPYEPCLGNDNNQFYIQMIVFFRDLLKKFNPFEDQQKIKRTLLLIDFFNQKMNYLI